VDLLTSLVDTTDFPPRWYCGSWTPALAARSSAPAPPVRTGPRNTPGLLGRRAETDWIDRLPIMRGLTPQDVRRQKEAAARARLFQLVTPDREVILPGPSDGRELVSRYVAPGSEGPTRQILQAGQSDGLARIV
jgi:hypothetical protein